MYKLFTFNFLTNYCFNITNLIKICWKLAQHWHHHIIMNLIILRLFVCPMDCLLQSVKSSGDFTSRFLITIPNHKRFKMLICSKKMYRWSWGALMKKVGCTCTIQEDRMSSSTFTVLERLSLPLLHFIIRPCQCCSLTPVITCLDHRWPSQSSVVQIPSRLLSL